MRSHNVVVVVVGHADPADLSLVAQTLKLTHGVGGIHPIYRPVHLIQVNVIHLQRREAALECHAHVRTRGLTPDIQAIGTHLPRNAALGGHDDVVATLSHDLAHNHLGAPLTVDVGRVDPVDAGVERRVTGRLAISIVGAAPAPAKLPGA